MTVRFGVLGIIGFVCWFSPYVHGGQTAWYHEGARQARDTHRKTLDGTHLHEETAFDHIPTFKRGHDVNEENATSHDYEVLMKDVVRVQLVSDRPRIDPNTDPIFVNANQAIDNPEATLHKQTARYIDKKDYEEITCIDTRDDEFDVVNMARMDPYYEHYEVWQFYNHCPNTPSHCGWGKRNDCPNYLRNHSILKPTRRPKADTEETRGTSWIDDTNPAFDCLLRTGKCRLKKEMPKEEGKESRMIPVYYYKKMEVADKRDWEITKIEDYRAERSRLRSPRDFGVESFIKIQVYVCSYQTPGNTCNVLRSQGAVEIQSSCIERMGGVCVKWHKRYNVPKRGAVQKTKATVLSGHKEPFNLDGRMDDKQYRENTEAPEAIAKLQALHDVGAALPKINTSDPNALSIFHGEDLRCVRQSGAWSRHSCPGMKGDKNADEQKLEKRHNEGKCIWVGCYEEKGKNIGTFIGQKREVTTYCCFESILSKVLHQGAHEQGVKTFGDAKAPNCGSLTLGQLQRLNWDRVDFGPFVTDMMSRVNLNAGHVAQKSATTVQSHLSHQMMAAQSARMREQAQTSLERGGG